jgi:hypothetical protein
MADIVSMPSIICPACKSTSFLSSSTGVIFKKTIHKCTNCGTVLEQSSSDPKNVYKVSKIGEEYSNAAGLLEGKRFTTNELGTHELHIFSDTQLEAFANGELDNLHIQMVGDASLNIVLKKDEKIVFYLAPIDLLEEKSQQVRTGGGSFSFRIAKGWWYRTPAIRSPQYASVLTNIDSGVLAVTNKRYIFSGSKRSIDQPYTKITSIRPYNDGMGIARSNKEKTEVFTGNYHWPFISSIIMGLVKNANSES